MNPEPTPTPREQIEMRLTALLMGELSAEETVALHALIAADPELARLHARLRQAMELLREATAEPEPATPTPARLSSERRERLLAHFKGPAPQPAPQPAPVAKAPRRDWSWVLPLGVAASVVFLLAGLALPTFSALKMSANRTTFTDEPPDFSAESASRVEDSESEEKSARWRNAEAPHGSVILTEPSKPSPDAPPANAVTKSGSSSLALAPAEKSKASPLYLPAPPPPAAEPAAPILGDIPIIGRLFTSTNESGAPQSGEKNDGRSPQDRETGGADGQKPNRAAPFPVTPTTPTAFEKSQLAGGLGLPLDPAPPVTEFEGFINYGNALATTPPVPTVPMKPPAEPITIVREFDYLSLRGEKAAKQSGQDAPDTGKLAARPTDGDKQLEITAKYAEIRQSNLEELNLDSLLGKDAAKTEPNTASDGTDRGDTNDPRRPGNKDEGEKVNLPKARPAPETTAPPMGQDLAKLKEREADPFGDEDANLRAPAVPKPAVIAPPQSAPMPDAPAPAVAPPGKEIALKPRAPEELYKKIDEMKKLPGAGAEVNGKPGTDADRKEDAPAARPAPPAAIPQPEVATTANAFSTFSLNVSDVSFKLAGASLEKGQMPEPATVRSEEFINAFDYRDPEPAAGAPLAFATERARYPFAQNRDLVRFSVKTAAGGRQPGRPLNLVLLLDNSGSMERADRVRILREALRVLAAQLQPQDRLSVVSFARTPRLWADGVAGDKAGAAVARVGEITPQGGTNLAAALDLGYATALKHYQPGSISRVVLLTDGAANLGDVNPDALKQKVETNRQRGVALDCFGIGWEGYDDTLLETLARNGDGRYGFINTPEDAASGFAAQLAGALRVAASDVKVQVEWNPRRVTAYRQIGYAKHQLKKEQFRDNTVDAAEIGAAESGNALYVVEVNPRGTGDLATVRVRFKVPGTADYKEHEWTVPFTPTAPSLEQASPALRLAGTASAFSEWLVASPFAAEVTTDRLLGLLNGVPAHYPADPRPKKLEWMIRTAKSVSGR